MPIALDAAYDFPMDCASAPVPSDATPAELAWRLGERVKELTCLYGIAQIAAEAELEREQILERTVRLLPPAWQHPAVTVARITVDGVTRETGPIDPSWDLMRSDIVTGARRRGAVEVAYSEKREPWDEGPFLREERSLLDAVARQVAVLLDRRQARKEQARLRHELDEVVRRLLTLDEGPTDAAASDPAPRRGPGGRFRTLAEIETEHISAVLESVGGNKSRAAQILGIDRKTLRERMKIRRLGGATS